MIGYISKSQLLEVKRNMSMVLGKHSILVFGAQKCKSLNLFSSSRGSEPSQTDQLQNPNGEETWMYTLTTRCSGDGLN